MSDHAVVVIRTTKDDHDIIAVLEGTDEDGVIKVKHPHYVVFNTLTQRITIAPFCPLSDEIFFNIPPGIVRFLVLANDDVAGKFNRMLNAMDGGSAESFNMPESTETQTIH